ncbi:DUF596 domain-containing protein [Erwinia sp. B116]|uniref:DUF596 domain-containing protein n=1 Tax=Erwinia sp. B116 TaxID=1561024 RepID=UPI003519A757
MKNITELCASVTESAYGLSMGTIWQHICVECVECVELPDNYLFRKHAFFVLLTALLSTGKIKLAAEGVFLPGSVEQQITLIQQAWPPYPSVDEDDELDHVGMWFLAKSPAGVVWLTPDGTEIWT